MNRCGWVTSHDIYVQYHDREWGVPLHDDNKLFEMLILEGAQAGLSWLTILQRREAYRRAYDNFNPEKMAAWDELKIEELLKNPDIIRNRLKIMAARTNARAYLKIVEKHGSFDRYLWSLVGGVSIQNQWESQDQVPPSTPESKAMAATLKNQGFKFVGPTICYAFMQAVGMVNDHITTCFRHGEIAMLQL